MRFYSLENCKKLQALGCVSDSGYFWVPKPYQESTEIKSWTVRYGTGHWKIFFPTYTNLNFLDTTETARENCRKRWGVENHKDKKNIYGEYLESCFCGEDVSGKSTSFCWQTYRHLMLDSPDGEKYVMEGL